MNEIYVFGGYTFKRFRSTVIEKYHENLDFWEELSFKLPFGVEASVMIPRRNNEVLILGGTKQDGST